jgi:hypothetical protein
VSVARARRAALRILVAGAALLCAWAVWVSTLGTPAAANLLPAGADAVVELHDVGVVVERLAGTRFAAAFAKSASREWLERTEAVIALDALLAGVRRVTGIPLGRKSVLHLLGEETACAWYPREGTPDAEPRWVAACRLSLRAWAVSGMLRIAERFVPTAGVTRAEVAGRPVFTVGGAGGRPLHLFLAGRTLVLSPARDLAARAVQAADAASSAMPSDPGLQAIRGALPSRGEIFLWGRGAGLAISPGLAGLSAYRSAGALLKLGKSIDIDAAAELPVGHAGTADRGAKHLPALALLKRQPLAFVASRKEPPEFLIDLLQERLRTAARRGAAAHDESPVLPAGGYALALTGGAASTGLLPAPRGLIAIGMKDATAARTALPRLFPPGARSAPAGAATALASRESIPLAGTFDLWGAAIGQDLVFATDTGLIEAAGESPATPGASREEAPGWQVDTVAALSMEQALPLLRRWAPPLSGLIAARWPEIPDLTRDLDLLSAVRSVRITVGSEDRRDRALATILLRDVP